MCDQRVYNGQMQAYAGYKGNDTFVAGYQVDCQGVAHLLPVIQLFTVQIPCHCYLVLTEPYVLPSMSQCIDIEGRHINLVLIESDLIDMLLYCEFHN